MVVSAPDDAGGLFGRHSTGRSVWVSGLADDVPKATLVEWIEAHRSREGSAASFSVCRLPGGAWVHFTGSALAHSCIVALNGSVLPGPKGSTFSLRLRYAAHAEDTTTPPPVTYLKRSLASALSSGSDSVPAAAGRGDGNDVKRPKLDGGSRPADDKEGASASSAQQRAAAAQHQQQGSGQGQQQGQGQPSSSQQSAAIAPQRQVRDHPHA